MVTGLVKPDEKKCLVTSHTLFYILRVARMDQRWEHSTTVMNNPRRLHSPFGDSKDVIPSLLHFTSI